MLYMLDTDICSYIIRGGYTAVERHLDITSPLDRCVSAITKAELLYGLKSLAEAHYLQAMVPQFIEVVNILAWGADAAEHYAEIRYQLRISGSSIGEVDMLIAAHALAADAVLVTNNTRHFDRIKLPLKLENWMQ